MRLPTPAAVHASQPTNQRHASPFLMQARYSQPSLTSLCNLLSAQQLSCTSSLPFQQVPTPSFANASGHMPWSPDTNDLFAHHPPTPACPACYQSPCPALLLPLTHQHYHQLSSCTVCQLPCKGQHASATFTCKSRPCNGHAAHA